MKEWTRALVTGGCGFVGSNLTAGLLELGWKVCIFDNLSREGSAANLEWLRTFAGDRLDFQQGDTRSSTQVDALVQRLQPEVIFHLAGQVAMTSSLEGPRQDFEINVLGSLNVLEAVRRYSPRTTIVYSSSNKVYGSLELDLVETETRYEPRLLHTGIDESARIEFHTPYGCSKGAADQYMLDYARSFGLNTVVLRHSTIYGGRQFATFDQGWVGWFCRKALEVRRDPTVTPFTIAGNGKQVRDLLHVSDAVGCYLSACESIEKVRGEAFNIGGGSENSMSLLELFSFLEYELKVRLSYEQLPWRRSDQKFFVADNTKALRMLGWHPTVTFERGLLSALSWEQHLAELAAADRDHLIQTT